MRNSFSVKLQIPSNSLPSDGKEVKQVIKDANQVIKQTANDVDQVKRSSSSYVPLLVPTVSCR